MSLAQYSDLQTAITNFTHRSDLTSISGDLITLAETRIMRELRSRDMETAYSSTISSGGTLSIPSNFIEFKELYINASPIAYLEKRSAKWIRDKYPQTSVVNTPRYYAREATSIIFGPYADSQYNVAGVFYKNRGPLSTNTTHATFTNNPDLYLFAALCEAAPYLKGDNRIPVWEAKYKHILDTANKQAGNEDWSGSELRVIAA